MQIWPIGMIRKGRGRSCGLQGGNERMSHFSPSLLAWTETLPLQLLRPALYVCWGETSCGGKINYRSRPTQISQGSGQEPFDELIHGLYHTDSFAIRSKLGRSFHYPTQQFDLHSHSDSGQMNIQSVSRKIDLVPWDYTSAEHIERMVIQREACGYKAEDVGAWAEEGKMGTRMLYWIVTAPLPSFLCPFLARRDEEEIIKNLHTRLYFRPNTI